MVSPHKRKSSKRKAGGIPFDLHSVITRTEVTRKVKKRVVTKSTNVVVPKAPAAPLAPDSSPPDQDIPQAPDKQTRKGPSRSVAVRPHFLYFTLTNYLRNQSLHTVKSRTVAPAQGRIRR